MKKMISGLIGILFLCLSFEQAWADSAEANAITKTEVEIIQDQSEHSQVNTYEKRPHIFVPPGTGVFVFPPSTLDEGGWKTMMYEPLLKEFSYSDLQSVKIKNKGLWKELTKDYLKKTVFHSRVGALPQKYIDKVTRLDWYHTGSPEVGEVSHPGDILLGEYEVIGQKKWTTMAPLLLGILNAMEETYCKRIVVQPKLKKEAYNSGFSIGSGAAAGAMMGSSGKADDKAGFISLGGLIGKTWAGMWSAFDFRILALNQGPIEPPANWWKLVLKPKPEEKPKAELEELNKTLAGLKEAIKDLGKQAEKPMVIKIETSPPAPPVVVTPPPPPPKPEPKAEKIELPQVVVYFDFDKYEIKETEKPKIKRTAEWLMANPTRIAQTEGHCSEPGSLDYNASLGRKRSLAVYEALLKDGASKDQVFQYISVSKDRLVSGKNDKNQRVIIRLIGPASGK